MLILLSEDILHNTSLSITDTGVGYCTTVNSKFQYCITVCNEI